MTKRIGLVALVLFVGVGTVGAQGYPDSSDPGEGYPDGTGDTTGGGTDGTTGGTTDGTGGTYGTTDETGSYGTTNDGTPTDAGWADTGDAVEIAPEGGAYPVNRTMRPITLPAMHLRGALGFFAVHFDLGIPGADDTATLLDLSASFGILDDLEVGFGERPGSTRRPGLLNLQLSPDADVNDIYFYGRYRLLALDGFELGAELGFVFPVDTDFGLVVAVPVRVRAGGIFSLDTGVAFDVAFADPDAIANLRIPLLARIAPIDPLYFGVDTGVVLPNLTNFEGDFVTIPLGFRAGYVIEARPLLIDVFAEFSFPLFLQPASDGDAVVTELWQLGVGARVVVDLDGGA